MDQAAADGGLVERRSAHRGRCSEPGGSGPRLPPCPPPHCSRALQPRTAGSGGSLSTEEAARRALSDIIERLPDAIDLVDLRARAEEVTPYVAVAIQVGGWLGGWG